MPTDLAKTRVVVTGGAGFVGRVVCQKLRERGCPPGNILVPRRAEFDLTHEESVKRLYTQMKPDVVIHLAAEVGGIGRGRAATSPSPRPIAGTGRRAVWWRRSARGPPTC